MLTDKLRQHRGAASILLLIVLLPSLTMAGVFVDLARTSLAQEVVSSSADLALNTVMTDYDKDLKEYFGLIASSQNTADIISTSKDYFVSSMVSAGVETSTAESYFNQITAPFLGGDQVSDMLQISVVEGTLDIKGTANGSMHNPALVKEGISEFMKYRSPINGAATLFAKITESGAAEKLQSASAEATMIDAREAFYKAEKKLIKQAEKAYKAIKKYEKYKAHTGHLVASEEFLNDFSSFLIHPLRNVKDVSKETVNQLINTVGEDFEKIYKDAHIKMVKNLFNTHSTSGTYPSTVMKTKGIASQSEVTTYNADSLASAANVKTLLKEFNGAVSGYISAKNALQSDWEKIGSKGNGDYGVQYWAKLTKTCSSAYGQYVTAAQNVWKAANKLSNAVAYCKEDALTGLMDRPQNSYVTMPQADENGNVVINDVYTALWTKYTSEIQNEQAGGSTAYRHINNQIGRLENSCDSLMNLTTVKHIYSLRNDLNNYYKDFQKAASLAETARKEVAALEDLITQYKKKFDEWKQAAYVEELNNNELAKQDRGLIDELEDGGMINMSKASVTELAAKMKNIYTLFHTLEEDINDMKYNNTSVLKISRFPDFVKACKASASAVPVNEDSLNKYADNLFSFSMNQELQDIRISDGKTSTTLDAGEYYQVTDSFHPLINKEKTFDLYKWLEEMFGKGVPGGSTLNKEQHGVVVDDEESAEEADEKFDKKTDDTSVADTTAGTKAKNFKDVSKVNTAGLPSKDKKQVEEKTLTTQLKDAASYASSLFSNFGETFMGTLENVRDDLYAVDYIFSTFTHDTFDNEGYYSNLSDEAKGEVKPSNIDTYYTEDIKKAWTGSDEIKTLTLHPRTKTTNWAYGGEIEYILYGNDTDQKNKNTAYTNIFMLRYALDLAPVFDRYWKDPTVEAIATALQAFAYIPVSLTKTVICLAITAAEAGVDINYLKYGIPVLLYKADSKKQLFCTYESVFLNKEGRDSLGDGIKLSYSDYLKMFLFIKLTSDENQIYLRTADVIQANMASITGEKGYALSKSQVYYTLSATARVEPMWSRLLAVDDLGDLSTSEGWRSMKITMTRGY